MVYVKFCILDSCKLIIEVNNAMGVYLLRNGHLVIAKCEQLDFDGVDIIDGRHPAYGLWLRRAVQASEELEVALSKGESPPKADNQWSFVTA
jgi:hypothetical protein